MDKYNTQAINVPSGKYSEGASDTVADIQNSWPNLSTLTEKFMNDSVDFDCIGNGMRELTLEEVACVSGADLNSAKIAVGAAVGIATATWGSSFGAVAVGVAIGGAPIAVLAIVACMGYAGYTLFLRPPVMMR